MRGQSTPEFLASFVSETSVNVCFLWSKTVEEELRSSVRDTLTGMQVFAVSVRGVLSQPGQLLIR